MKTLIGWMRAASLCVLLLGSIPSALGQEISPLIVTGTASSELQLVKTTGTDRIWTLNGDGGTFTFRDNSVTILRIDADSPQNSQRIHSTGRVAFCTTAQFITPQRTLHAVDGNGPALRLEQTDTLGNPPQAFDLESSELGFSVIDVTNANNIPFTIEPGAPSNSLFVASTGDVGIGTGTPTVPLHVIKATQEATAEILARFSVADDVSGRLEIRNGSTTDGIFHPRLRGTTGLQAVPLTFEGVITLDVGVNPVVAYDAAKASGGAVATRPLVVYRNNGVSKVIIGPTGIVTATSFNPVSSRALKHDIEDLDSQEAANALRQLAPVKYVYNDDESNQKRVGFIAEDVPEVVATPDRQSVPIMDVVALVTRVVKDQQQTIDEQAKALVEQAKAMDQQAKAFEQQNKFIAEQRKLNELLMKRLGELESQVSARK